MKTTRRGLFGLFGAVAVAPAAVALARETPPAELKPDLKAELQDCKRYFGEPGAHTHSFTDPGHTHAIYPFSPGAGQVWWDAGSSRMYVYDGQTWNLIPNRIA